MVTQVKTLLKKLSEVQSNDAFLMFNSLDIFLQILARLLFRSELYPTRVNKLALISVYRIVNTNIYNQFNRHDPTNSSLSDGVGCLLVSPVKFKNFEPQI